MRAATAAVPRGLPQTAASGEHLAALIAGLWAQAAVEAGERPFRVLADCASVVSAWTGGPSRAEDARRPYAGIWRQVPRQALEGVFKTQAHMSREEAVRRGRLVEWAGNDRADEFAKKAAGVHRASREALLARRAEAKRRAGLLRRHGQGPGPLAELS